MSAQPISIQDQDEIYNIQSTERQELLQQLKQAMGTENVSVPFWACLQVCDLNCLRKMIANTCSGPIFINVLQSTALAIPLHWMQKSPGERNLGTSSPASPATPNRPFGTPDRAPSRRSQALKNLVMERDDTLCILTKMGCVTEVAHIYPVSLLQPQQRSNLAACIPPFWHLLRIFFDQNRLDKWHSAIFRDALQPDRAMDGVFNQICLTASAHTAWTKGLFALRPLQEAADRRSLSVELHWQPVQTHTKFDAIDLLSPPGQSRDLEGSGSFVLYSRIFNRLLRTGDILVLTTHNPETHPLPSFALLEMQWFLTRIVSMSAAADEYNRNNFNDDVEGAAPALDTFHSRALHESISEMFSSTPKWQHDPQLSQSNSSVGEREDDDVEQSVTTASVGPSPSKTRQVENTLSAVTEDSASEA
ncbi:hypothetical protein ASPZODRAFT_163205 [Penicilliopsis zonata CBS 506.65]|uniref:HNH nuclease domain-containing protein n=1 Tax=Penicilliopsis zonata CBS 506.65 TaxID=1073090 RepID=A0A1L9SVZ8_9EURO|nr:hypothetical protein ASPZODRAFT_163205 [Penicilliopsis zonata CBS 506.65]OJJ51356.1 hypothetical protein ASPZODRAFT_163205 [Penicilliopsis zonata CBS 506.65]